MPSKGTICPKCGYELGKWAMQCPKCRHDFSKEESLGELATRHLKKLECMLCYGTKRIVDEIGDSVPCPNCSEKATEDE